MKKIISSIVLILLAQLTQLSAKEQREITLYGKVDPRLVVSARSLYRSMDPKDIRSNFEECTRSDWNTGTRKRSIDYEIAYLTPDKNGNYKTIIPIDYKEDNPCGYEYVNTKLILRRDKKDDSYVKIHVISTDNTPSNSRGLYSGGSQGIKRVETDKKYFQISSGSKIECFTEHFIYKERESTSFICEPEAANDINGVDELKSKSIKVDIIINDNKSALYNTLDKNYVRGFPEHDVFRDYKKTLTSFEKFKLYIKNLINKKDD